MLAVLSLLRLRGGGPSAESRSQDDTEMSEDSAVSEPPAAVMGLRKGRLGRDAANSNELDVEFGNICVLY